jgi:hypothetical protein
LEFNPAPANKPLLQLVELPFEGIAGTADGRLALRALKAQALGDGRIQLDPLCGASPKVRAGLIAAGSRGAAFTSGAQRA